MSERRIKQLRAISYAYSWKRKEQAREAVNKLKRAGVIIEVSAYPAVTLRRCEKAFEMLAKSEEVDQI